MDATSLKLLALVLMVGDHGAAFFEPALPVGVYLGLRYVGRVVAPVFFYLSVESVFKTRSVKRYLLRLYGWAGLVVVGNWVGWKLTGELVGHNILATIALGVTLVVWLEWVKNQREKLLKAFGVGLVGFCGLLMLFTEYSFWALGMYLLFYGYRKNKNQMLMAFLLYGVADVIRAYFLGFGEFMVDDYQWLMVLALPWLYLYDGKRGKGLKSWFYVFYPVHLWVLYCLKGWFLGS